MTVAQKRLITLALLMAVTVCLVVSCAIWPPVTVDGRGLLALFVAVATIVIAVKRRP